MLHRSNPLGIVMGCAFSVMSSLATIGATTLENIAIWERVIAGGIGVIASAFGLYVALQSARKKK